MTIEKPIFILGVGRSGSTVFHNMFSNHPQVAWLSVLCDRYPDKPSINGLLMKAIDYPIIGRYFKKRASAVECYVFWEYYCKGFRYPCRDLGPEDVTNKTKGAIQSALSETLTDKRSRLLAKTTGWPRIGFWREIFDDAKFIHVLRDGRALVNSMINVNWWWGWRGPQNWRWGELSPAQKEEWERHDKSFIALACIEWKILMDALEKAKTFVDKSNFLEIKYEDLCGNSQSVFRRVVEFCDLEWSREFEKAIAKYALADRNYKWKKELTIEQQEIAQDVLHEYLARYGYIDDV